jgi:biopolymer transport protein ExbD
MGEMNTTPRIDVMLVLLTMFILTIPIQTHSVGIDLPQKPKKTIRPPVDTVKNRLGICADGIIRWNGTAIDRMTLRQYLAASLRLPVEPELQFQPDASTRHRACRRQAR